MKEALIEVSEGKKYICREIREILAGNFISDENKVNFNTLSVREIEIIELVRQGFSSKEIAIEKSISVKTVEVHRYNILKKLNLRNAAELVNYFNKNDI
jgi:two-component system invasion response regulator UvrY